MCLWFLCRVPVVARVVTGAVASARSRVSLDLLTFLPPPPLPQCYVPALVGLVAVQNPSEMDVDVLVHVKAFLEHLLR